MDWSDGWQASQDRRTGQANRHAECRHRNGDRHDRRGRSATREAHAAVVNANVDLAAAIKLLPNHDQVPDLTGGLGATIYNGNQALADQLIRAVVNGISLTAFAQAAGLDPQSLVNKLLVDIPANLLPDILATISLDLPILDTLLPAVGLGDQQLLTKVLDLLGVDEIAHNTLTGLLALFGLDLADPFNLSNLLATDSASTSSSWARSSRR